MKQVDAHQHFWQFDPVRDTWIDDSMQVLRRNYLPEDLESVLIENGIDSCVAVQADQSETETNFLLDLAANHSFIKGVVGWVDLLDDQLGNRLSYFCENPLFKGVRHIAQAEADDFFLRLDVQKGIAQLTEYDLTYDILIYEHQLPAAIELVKQFPEQQFVLDHMAKPQISNGISDNWQSNMLQLARFPNINCKLSGLLTETSNYQWKKDEFLPFLEFIFSVFPLDRLIYGSDWPVCLLAATYQEQRLILEDFIASLSPDEQAKIMGANAIRVYNLNMEGP